jgi:hypothetical protein
MNTAIWQSLVVVLVLSIAVACSPSSPGGDEEDGSSLPPGGSSITSREASAYMGEDATVCGPVVDSRYARTSRGSPTFLNFDFPYPSHTFTVVIWGDDLGGFPSNPDTYYSGNTVCASGLIEEYQGKPQIVASDDSQLVMGD